MTCITTGSRQFYSNQNGESKSLWENWTLLYNMELENLLRCLKGLLYCMCHSDIESCCSFVLCPVSHVP